MNGLIDVIYCVRVSTAEKTNYFPWWNRFCTLLLYCNASHDKKYLTLTCACYIWPRNIYGLMFYWDFTNGMHESISMFSLSMLPGMNLVDLWREKMTRWSWMGLAFQACKIMAWSNDGEGTSTFLFPGTLIPSYIDRWRSRCSGETTVSPWLVWPVQPA